MLNLKLLVILKKLSMFYGVFGSVLPEEVKVSVHM